MKFHWGTGALLLFGSFVIFMTGLVLFASRQSHELVTDDYYEEELTFIDILEKKKRAETLSEQPRWSVQEGNLVIDFPDEVGQNVSGEVIFFKPSAKRDDKTIPFETDNNIFVIDIRNFRAGMYRLKLDWKASDIEYFNQGIINLR